MNDESQPDTLAPSTANREAEPPRDIYALGAGGHLPLGPTREGPAKEDDFDIDLEDDLPVHHGADGAFSGNIDPKELMDFYSNKTRLGRRQKAQTEAHHDEAQDVEVDSAATSAASTRGRLTAQKLQELKAELKWDSVPVVEFVSNHSGVETSLEYLETRFPILAQCSSKADAEDTMRKDTMTEWATASRKAFEEGITIVILPSRQEEAAVSGSSEQGQL